MLGTESAVRLLMTDPNGSCDEDTCAQRQTGGGERVGGNPRCWAASSGQRVTGDGCKGAHHGPHVIKQPVIGQPGQVMLGVPDVAADIVRVQDKGWDRDHGKGKAGVFDALGALGQSRSAGDFVGLLLDLVANLLGVTPQPGHRVARDHATGDRKGADQNGGFRERALHDRGGRGEFDD
jgi:hypothetical protein